MKRPPSRLALEGFFEEALKRRAAERASAGPNASASASAGWAG